MQTINHASGSLSRMLTPPLKSRLLAASSGLLLTAAAPPLNLFFLGWIGLIPLLMSLKKPRTSGFGEGFIAGLVYNTGILYWLAFNSGTYWWLASLTMLVSVLAIAWGWGVAAKVFRILLDRLGAIAWVIIPFSWSAWEGWLSNLGDIAFPWPLLALTQAGFDPILQVMEFTGIWGVGFWVAAVNVVLFLCWRAEVRRRWRCGLALGVLAVIPVAAHIHTTRCQTPEACVRVLIVQGDIDPLGKWVEGFEFSWVRYDSLTRVGSNLQTCKLSDFQTLRLSNSLDLIVWPETAVPCDFATRQFYQERIANLAADIDAAIITGASGRARMKDGVHPLNIAYLVDPERGVVDGYSKRTLVPFGERVPFQDLFAGLGSLNFGQAEFRPGSRPTLFFVERNGKALRFPALICYESAFPEQVRRSVQDGANLLITISNDAWYGKSAERPQIAELSRFRCIETRRSMARASNTGISFGADYRGRILARTEIDVPETIVVDLPLMEVQTFYLRHGNWFLLLTTLTYGLALLRGVFKDSSKAGGIQP